MDSIFTGLPTLLSGLGALDALHSPIARQKWSCASGFRSVAMIKIHPYSNFGNFERPPAQLVAALADTNGLSVDCMDGHEQLSGQIPAANNSKFTGVAVTATALDNLGCWARWTRPAG